MHRTPSTTASPVPRRPLTRPDCPSPAKRRKLATANPEPSTAPSGSSSTPTLNLSPPELDAERRASSLRVLEVWSALADKHTRRLDEDDILDLRTGNLVRDRGVLRGTPRKWDFGCFSFEEGAAEGQEDDEENGSEDEIGAWRDTPELDNPFKPVHVPPVQELDPEDAKDLKEFLAAEAARKAQHGEDDDDDDDSVGNSPEHQERDDGDCPEDNNVDAYDVDTEGSFVEVEAGSALALCDDDSADELDGYDDTVGEGAMLFEVSPEVAKRCVKSVCQVHESTVITPTSPLLPMRRFQTPAQLRTPPLSRSSAMPSPTLIRKLPLALPPPQPVAPEKGQPSETHVPRVSQPPDAQICTPPKGRAKSFDTTIPLITPRKNVVPEVVIPPRFRASTVLPQTSDAREQTRLKRRGSLPSTSPKQATYRRASTSSPSKRPPPPPPPNPQFIDDPSRSSSESLLPPPPPRPAKKKRVLLQDAASEPEEDIRPVSPLQELEDERTASPQPTPSHDRRRSFVQQHREATVPMSHRTPHTLTQRHRESTAPTSHASRTSRDPWLPFVRHASMAPPYPVPYAPDRPSMPPHPPPPVDPQFLIAQALHGLSYLVSSPQSSWTQYPPPRAHSSAPSYHPARAPSLPPSSPPLSYAFPPHLQSHPPWPYTPYSYPYTPSSHAQPPPTSSSSVFPGRAPSSSPEPAPSLGKGKRKRVSFPDEVMPYGYEEEDEQDDVFLEAPESPTRDPRTQRSSWGYHDGKLPRDDPARISSPESSSKHVPRTAPPSTRSKSKSRH